MVGTERWCKNRSVRGKLREQYKSNSKGLNGVAFAAPLEPSFAYARVGKPEVPTRKRSEEAQEARRSPRMYERPCCTAFGYCMAKPVNVVFRAFGVVVDPVSAGR